MCVVPGSFLTIMMIMPLQALCTQNRCRLACIHQKIQNPAKPSGCATIILVQTQTLVKSFFCTCIDSHFFLAPLFYICTTKTARSIQSLSLFLPFFLPVCKLFANISLHTRFYSSENVHRQQQQGESQLTATG